MVSGFKTHSTNIVNFGNIWLCVTVASIVRSIAYDFNASYLGKVGSLTGGKNWTSNSKKKNANWFYNYLNPF